MRQTLTVHRELYKLLPENSVGLRDQDGFRCSLTGDAWSKTSLDRIVESARAVSVKRLEALVADVQLEELGA